MDADQWKGKYIDNQSTMKEKELLKILYTTKWK